MEGMSEAAEEILGMPVRLGFPVGVKGIVQLVQGPQYASGVGLVRFGAQRMDDGVCDVDYEDESEVRSRTSEALNRRGLWTWLKEAF
jgi:cell division protein FtsA